MFQQLPIDTKKEKKHTKAFFVSYTAILTALLFVLSLFDSLFNFSFGVPGVKAGFSNIVIVFSLYTNGFIFSLLLVSLKIIINTLIFGGFSSFLFSFWGSITGFFAMYLAKKFLKEKISCIGISAFGGFFHIAMQYTVSFFVMKSAAVFSFLPYAIILSLVSSVLVGIISELIIKRWFLK